MLEACTLLISSILISVVGTIGYAGVRSKVRNGAFDDVGHYLRWRFDQYGAGDEWRGQLREDELVCELCGDERGTPNDGIIVNVDEQGRPVTDDGVSFDEPTRVLCLEHINEKLD